MIEVKGLSESLLCFLCLFSVRYTIFNVGEKHNSTLQCFNNEIHVVFPFMVTNIITNVFHNHKHTTQSILGICPTRDIDKQDKTEVALFMSTPFSHI